MICLNTLLQEYYCHLRGSQVQFTRHFAYGSMVVITHTIEVYRSNEGRETYQFQRYLVVQVM